MMKPCPKCGCALCLCYGRQDKTPLIPIVPASGFRPAEVRYELPEVYGGSTPDDSKLRKEAPIASGVFDYFPDALWEVARCSWAGNEKHNPGEHLHDARGKSKDDADCLMRHFKDRGKWDEIITKDGRRIPVRHSAAVAWRALRILQKECEADGAPLAPGAVS